MAYAAIALPLSYQGRRQDQFHQLTIGGSKLRCAGGIRPDNVGTGEGTTRLGRTGEARSLNPYSSITEVLNIQAIAISVPTRSANQKKK